ncbi:MAG: flagellar M-ring protein FliF [Firmicutes bacterium]|nr:flagellar M-ring protein FliF [Bacillota bacterium]
MGELIQQIRHIWENMDKRKRLLFGGGMGLLLLLLVLVIALSQPEYELLYGNLQQVEQDEIIGRLREMNIPYRKEYNSLYVPNASEVRAELMKAGIPKGGIIGWELFDRSTLGATNFQNAVNYQRALQDEIRRTLRQIEGVVDAAVIINLPEQEPVFEDEKKEPTASITLNLSRPNMLSKSQVQAIVNFVASCVTGMSPERVTIIDNFANDLTAALRTSAALDGSLLEQQMALKTKMEQDYKRNIENVLGRVYGLHNVAATVNITLNFDYQEIRKETYGDRGVPRSEQEITESYTGTGMIPLGIPGTDSNITQYRIGGADQESTYERNERIVNTEINKVEEHFLKQGPTIERISVSVVIGQRLSAAEVAQIEDTVAATVGAVAARGDRVTVFSREFFTPTPESVPETPSTFPWPFVTVVVLGCLLLSGGVYYLVRRRRKKESTIDVVIGDTVEQTAATEEISPEEKKRREREEFITNLARNEPDTMVALLRTWMSED